MPEANEKHTLAAAEKRQAQTRLFLRSQAYGLLIIGALIALWRLFHSNLSWLFPPGWWRL